MRCPPCHGSGVSIALGKPLRGRCHAETFPCGDCQGTGHVPEDWHERKADGRRLRDLRVAAKKSLRDITALTSAPTSLIRDWERGRKDPPKAVVFLYEHL